MKKRTVFGRQLRKARDKAGISQKQLGIDAGIDEFSASPRINQYERGTHTPDFQTAKRLAECLRTPVEFFYSDNDLMADLILEISSLSEAEKQKLLESLQAARKSSQT